MLYCNKGHLQDPETRITVQKTQFREIAGLKLNLPLGRQLFIQHSLEPKYVTKNVDNVACDVIP